VHIMVASDALTRGMDVEGIANVVNYDVPVYVKTYVHRVGRTARAGQAGRAFTLMVKKEARHFKMELLSKLENGICKDYELPVSLIDVILPRFTAGTTIATTYIRNQLDDLSNSSIQQVDYDITTISICLLSASQHQD
jgi:superfamily II DNA/RNA helicase